MPNDLKLAMASSRILIEADLQPLQGTRFQPTGFPSLGAAEYRRPDGTPMLLVESPQSMANRLEAVTWDDARSDLVAALDGIPYVATTGEDCATDSIREAHRLNSPYLEGVRPSLQKRANISGKKSKGSTSTDGETDESSGVDIRRLAEAVFYYDPNSLIHGVFLEKIAGTARLTRVLSGFIEAENARPAESGGVKNDRVDPSGKHKGGAEKGFGNVPYARTEYTAGSITAFFSIDVALLKSYGLKTEAEELIIAIALWKVLKFLEVGGRLRTACDLEVQETRVKRPSGWEIPPTSALEAIIKDKIAACTSAGLFAKPPKTEVKYPK